MKAGDNSIKKKLFLSKFEVELRLTLQPLWPCSWHLNVRMSDFLKYAYFFFSLSTAFYLDYTFLQTLFIEKKYVYFDLNSRQ